VSHDLTGKCLLVAGASSGIGAATAMRAAASGANVLLFARRPDQLRIVQGRIDAHGGKASVVTGDATDEAAVEAAVDEAVARYGKLDILVNSVGVNVPDRALTVLTRERWRHLIVANLDAAYVLTQAALPVFRRQHDGLLLHISSASAKHADASGVGYQASKAGVAALAHATMEEEREHGIRVTVVYPGSTNTPLVYQRPVPPDPQTLARALDPDDVARMCVAVMGLPPRAHVPELVLRPRQQ
jgi:NAD(P)-dependent dehydrogenase (short-subunit alcohol dehydrogenase family)